MVKEVLSRLKPEGKNQSQIEKLSEINEKLALVPYEEPVVHARNITPPDWVPGEGVDDASPYPGREELPEGQRKLTPPVPVQLESPAPDIGPEGPGQFGPYTPRQLDVQAERLKT